MNKRTDYKMALMVEAVIHDATLGSPVAAARQLAELGVPLEVAMRVITRPSERRNHVEEIGDVRLTETGAALDHLGR
jgi:hypothetical protein